MQQQNTTQEPRVIIALDFDDMNKALRLVDQLNPALCRVKVGKEMFTRFGPDLVKRLQKNNFSVFLDLKFHDIPNTVAKACLAAADLGVWMVNVHALGGSKMMAAARNALDKISGPRPLLIAVTLLTSMAGADAAEVGLTGLPETIVARLAKLAQQQGMDGVVCSGQEAAAIRRNSGPDFKLVAVGIRLDSDKTNDQQRIMTPRDALAAGADYLVIGRPVTAAAVPLEALQHIQREIVAI